MRARLFSRVGETKGADFEIGSGATLGRHPGNEIVLEPSLVSSRHARITYDPEAGCYVLEDLGSLNGTALDGQRVVGRERLGHLHVITFADQHDFIFQDLERCLRRHGVGRGAGAVGPELQKSPPAPQGALQPVPMSQVPEEKTAIERVPVALPGSLAGSGEPEAAPPESRDPGGKTMAEKLPVALPGFLAGSGESAATPPEPGDPGDKTMAEKLPVALPGFLAGEAPTAAPAGDESPPPEVLELMADGAGKATFYLEFVDDGGVRRVELVDGENLVGRGGGARIQPDNLDISRRHAALTVAGDKVTVRDLGSRNRTFLGGEEIAGEVEVTPGAPLRFGSVEARLVVVEGE